MYKGCPPIFGLFWPPLPSCQLFIHSDLKPLKKNILLDLTLFTNNTFLSWSFSLAHNFRFFMLSLKIWSHFCCFTQLCPPIHSNSSTLISNQLDFGHNYILEGPEKWTHTVLLETDVRRSDFVVIFFNWPKTGQPLILKSILDPLFNGIQEDYLAKV